jgi:hypothetical protein
LSKSIWGNTNLGDLIILRAVLRLGAKARFLNLDYGYNLFRDNRSNVDFLVGVYSPGLSYEFEANRLNEILGVANNRN